MKKLIVCLLALCLLLPAAWAEEFRYEGDGYATADEAAVAYANAFARGDVMGMLSTFAVESYVDHFDSEAYLSYIRIYRPTNAQAMLPLPYQEGYGRQLGSWTAFLLSPTIFAGSMWPCAAWRERRTSPM